MSRARRGQAATVPLGALPLAVIAAAFVVLPLAGLLANVSWSQLVTQLDAVQTRQALWLSVLCPVLATLLSAVLGVPLAWVLARARFPGRALLRALVVLPMVLPPVVGGVALLYAFGRRGLVGGWFFDHLGLSLPYTTAGVVVAEAFVGMPFLVLTVEVAISQYGISWDEAAATLGARRLTTLWRVTLPMLAPSLAVGAILCWARSLGELGASITFAGNLPGSTQTLPLAVFIALQTQPESAAALSLILFALSLIVLIALRGRWWSPR